MADPKNITVILKEIETIFLFEMASEVSPKGTFEGDLTEQENALVIEKNGIYKTESDETQTDQCILKIKAVQTPLIYVKDSEAFASAWDMFDSYKNPEKPLPKKTSIQTSRFEEAVTITERVLANNAFEKEQWYFKDLPKRLENQDHELIHLWSLVSEQTINRYVTGMCWNKQNNDILAVCYGGRDSKDQSGIITIWNIKNPVRPEKVHDFNTPATCIQFSNENPNLLTVGFHNGDVIILDISAEKIKILAKNSQYDRFCWRPIRQIDWVFSEDDFEQEFVMTIQDVRVCKFLRNQTGDFEENEIMRTNPTNSIWSLHETNDNIHIRGPPCCMLCFHPKDFDIYFIGTLEGNIIKCAFTDPQQRISVFKAHEGPIYDMQFSNYNSTIFITCGADQRVKVWSENISEPLIVLKTKGPTESLSFCPTNPAIIVAITGQHFLLWDLRCTFDMLRFESDISFGSRHTKIMFSRNGRNLIVGDSCGKVHVYNLSNVLNYDDITINVLNDALKKVLAVKPELLQKFSTLL